MTSNLDCIGLGVDDHAGMDRLVTIALRSAERLGQARGVSVLRWQDASGGRLILGVRGNEVTDLLPSYAGEPGARVAAFVLSARMSWWLTSLTRMVSR